MELFKSESRHTGMPFVGCIWSLGGAAKHEDNTGLLIWFEKAESAREKAGREYKKDDKISDIKTLVPTQEEWTAEAKVIATDT